MFKHFNIEDTTTLEEVKKQYRKLSMKAHPDKGGSLEEFREVNEEYRKALEWIQKQAAKEKDINLYQRINQQLIDVDSLINKLKVPEQLKPALSYLTELGVNHLGKVISQKLQG